MHNIYLTSSSSGISAGVISRFFVLESNNKTFPLSCVFLHSVCRVRRGDSLQMSGSITNTWTVATCFLKIRKFSFQNYVYIVTSGRKVDSNFLSPIWAFLRARFFVGVGILLEFLLARQTNFLVTVGCFFFLLAGLDMEAQQRLFCAPWFVVPAGWNPNSRLCSPHIEVLLGILPVFLITLFLVLVLLLLLLV